LFWRVAFVLLLCCFVVDVLLLCCFSVVWTFGCFAILLLQCCCSCLAVLLFCFCSRLLLFFAAILCCYLKTRPIKYFGAGMNEGCSSIRVRLLPTQDLIYA
jgi:hypothetical protein